MADQPALRFDFPKPRGAVKVLLFLIGGLALLDAILVNWVGSTALLEWTVADKRTLPLQVYRLITSLVITSPAQYGHALFSLMLLFFFGPAVESQTGTKKLLALFFGGGVLGTLLGFAANATGLERISAPLFYGPTAALETLVVAWSMQNAHAVVQLFFVLPIRGSWMKWISLGFCTLGLIFYKDAPPEGALAGFGGFLVGVAFGKNPSPLRTFFLKKKLGRLERERDRVRGKGPPLRVVYGGLADDLELGKRKPGKPPKDKRTLN